MNIKKNESRFLCICLLANQCPWKFIEAFAPNCNVLDWILYLRSKWLFQYYFKNSRGIQETPQLETKHLIIPCTAKQWTSAYLLESSETGQVELAYSRRGPGPRVQGSVTETMWHQGMDRPCNLVLEQEHAGLTQIHGRWSFPVLARLISYSGPGIIPSYSLLTNAQFLVLMFVSRCPSKTSCANR